MPKSRKVTVAEVYLRLLKSRGVDYIFANAGTDFAPIIEAYAAVKDQSKLPEPITVPHENVAISMAHGYYLATGKVAAVMVHVTVGTANAICGLYNASRDRVPILFTAGRTPLTEFELHGSRNAGIHWAQEMFDQAGMLRELVKWDYELRNGAQVASVVDRALELARSEPGGPVYLSLPREVLGMDVELPEIGDGSLRRPAVPAAADANAIDEAADILSRAENPLIVSRNAGRNAESAAALDALASAYAIPVLEYRPCTNGLAGDHPMNLGFDAKPHVSEADVIVTLDTDAPFTKQMQSPPAEDCRIIQIGADPLFENYPIRGFPRELAITSTLESALPMLSDALGTRRNGVKKRADARRKRIREIQKSRAERMKGALRKAKAGVPIHPAWISHCLDQATGGEAMVFNDYGLQLPFMRNTKPRTHFGTPLAGGLGWGTGATIGARFGANGRLCVSATGDGSYMFSNPVPATQVSAAYDKPILSIVLNNSRWFAVQRATMSMYPQGKAVQSNRMAMSTLEPSPKFEMVADMMDGFGERVDDPAEMAGALDRAIKAVTVDRRPAVLNVICGADY